MANQQDKIYSIDNFIAGNILKLFSSNDTQSDTLFSVDKSSKNIINNQILLSSLYDPSVSAHLFYKDNKNIRLISNYSESAIIQFQQNLSQNLNAVYTDKEIKGKDLFTSLNSKFARKDYNYFFINDFKFNKFQDFNYKLLTNKYFPGSEYVKNYISASYSPDFYDNSLNVEDQSVPIYQFNYQALNDLDVIKFSSKDIVDQIIQEFQLQDIQSGITYNSSTDSIDSNSYDSLYILPIVKYNYEKYDEFCKFLFLSLADRQFFKLNSSSLLKDVEFFKFSSKQIVDKVLTQFNLFSIKDQILYNSISGKIDTKNYDSLILKPIQIKCQEWTTKFYKDDILSSQFNREFFDNNESIFLSSDFLTFESKEDVDLIIELQKHYLEDQKANILYNSVSGVLDPVNYDSIKLNNIYFLKSVAEKSQIFKNIVFNIYKFIFKDSQPIMLNDKFYQINKDRLFKYADFIKFSSSSQVDKFIQKTDLSAIKEQITYKSNAKCLNTQDYDSILLQPISEYKGSKAKFYGNLFQKYIIYQYNRQKLEKNIDIIKYSSSQEVDNVIDLFNLNLMKYQITYNSSECVIDSQTYDSIYTQPIKNYKLNKFYKFIFANLSKESFYRLFIPVGKITNVSGEFYQNIESTKSTSDLSQYMYYVNENNIQNSNSFSFNYFDLKNFQNPHDQYDYSPIENINQNLSVKSKAFSLSGMVKFNLSNFTIDFTKNLQEFIQSYFWKLYINTYINKKQILSGVINHGTQIYDEWPSATVSSLIVDDDPQFKFILLYNVFRLFYNLDMNKYPYLITKEQLSGFIQNSKQTFISNYVSGYPVSSDLENCSSVINYFETKIQNYNDKPSALLCGQFLNDYFMNNNFYTNVPGYREILDQYDPSLNKPVMHTIYHNAEKYSDYYKMFDTLYSHQNVMKKTSTLYGHRQYEDIFTSFDENLQAIYRYKVLDDKNFKEKYCDNDLRKLKNIALTKSLNYSQTIEVQKQKQNIQKSYKWMLDNIQKYPFVEKIQGFFKYKDLNMSKSNIYSIQLKNSNLNYTLYSFSEIINYCLLNKAQDGTTYDYDTDQFVLKDGTRINFLQYISQHDIDIVLQSNLNMNVDLLKLRGDIWNKLPFSSFKYYDKTDPLNNDIIFKIQIRKNLQQSIRQSIAKYMPLNTTLWKIQYSGK